MLLVFKDKSDKAQGNKERASVTLEEICGLETGQWYEGVAFTLAILCLNQAALLGFDSKEALLAWDARLRYSLGEGEGDLSTLLLWLLVCFVVQVPVCCRSYTIVKAILNKRISSSIMLAGFGVVAVREKCPVICQTYTEQVIFRYRFAPF